MFLVRGSRSSHADFGGSGQRVNVGGAMRRVPLSRRMVIGGSGLALALLAPAVGLGAAAAPAASVQVGDFNRSPEIEFNAFYPGHVKVTQGSTVKFSAFGFHTITFPGKGAKLPAFVIPSPTLNPATNDAAGAPYWWGGVTPQLSINPLVPGPAGGTKVTGAKTVSSGFLPDKNPTFTVSFPKTGTFQVRCLVHPNMRGSVTVVAKTGRTDGAAKLKARATREKKADRTAVNAAIKKTKSAAANVVTISPGTNRGEAFGFFPAKKSVAVGSQVTFTMGGRNEIHTVSFGPAKFLAAVSKKTFQGNGLALDGEGVYPSDPPAAGPPPVTLTAHGNGFVSSGALRDRGVPGPEPTSFTVSFPQAGTFSYICLIHTEMQGTITVS